MGTHLTLKEKPNKPRVRFCWHCSKKLWGNHYDVVEYMGIERIVHKQCKHKAEKEIKKEGVCHVQGQREDC
jgi:hypothetical protein